MTMRARRDRTVVLPDGDWWKPTGKWHLDRHGVPLRWRRPVTIDNGTTPCVLLGPVVDDGASKPVNGTRGFDGSWTAGSTVSVAYTSVVWP